ncbi:hypothetical protein MMC28_000815 [Mycoblastus sanguinarius]|nr:hypothetical protein [Mycoblastus sanguinarius]
MSTDSVLLPTRVIDVGADTTEPCLRVTNGQKDRYVALSHCWGPIDANKSRLMTLKSSLEQHKLGIPIASFPQTFRDAIRITRLLGVKYLWIDCLCIIQDDHDDWAKESAAMGRLYANAFITVAADKAQSSNEGCFLTEDDLGKRYYRMRFADEAGKSSFVYVRQRTRIQQSPTLETVSCYAEDARSKLETRAWTLQERLLSPRIVHFTETEMMWECNTRNICECGFPRPLSNLKQDYVEPKSTCADSITSNALGLEWRKVVEDYSDRSLTFSSDCLHALSGLVSTMQANASTDYLAGLWRSDLTTDLLWYSRTKGSTFFGEEERHPGRRHQIYHAPSWSWASVTGPVAFASAKMKPIWEILSADTEPSGPNPLGGVSNGRLKIKGHTARVRIERRTHINSRTEKEQVRHFAVSEAHPTVKKLQEVVSPDVGPDGTELEEEVPFHLLFAAEERGWPFALVLMGAADEGDVYERVGYVAAERFR